VTTATTVRIAPAPSCPELEARRDLLQGELRDALRDEQERSNTLTRAVVAGRPEAELAELRGARARVRDRIDELHAALPALEDAIREARRAEATAELGDTMDALSAEEEAADAEVASFQAGVRAVFNAYDAVSARRDRIRELAGRAQHLHGLTGSRGLPPVVDPDEAWARAGFSNSMVADGFWFECRALLAVVESLAAHPGRRSSGFLRWSKDRSSSRSPSRAPPPCDAQIELVES